MTRRIIAISLVAFFSLTLFAGRKTIQFNAMISNGKSKKAVEKHLKAAEGVKSVKINASTGTVEIGYDDEKCNVNKIANAFKSAGVYASPVGENCANKPGGCLNNAPTTTNSMK